LKLNLETELRRNVFGASGERYRLLRASERQKCYGPDKKILFKKQLLDLEAKGQGPTKVITVCDTPPYGHAPTYQI
jgi:hypothetical protein